MASNNKEVWIFLRGLAREARHWGAFVSEFEAANRRRTVVCLDLPGAGSRNSEQSPVSVSGIVDDLRLKFLEIKAENRNADFYILSVSLGGMIAIDWLNRYDDFSGAVLINSSVAGVSPVHHRMRPLAALKLFAISRERDIRKREAQILKLVSNRSDLLEAGAAAWAEIASTHPVNIRNFVAQLLAAATFRLRKFESATPILVLTGLGDRLIDSRASKALAKRLGAAHAEHLSAGHDLTFDDAPWVVKTVGDWLAK